MLESNDIKFEALEHEPTPTCEDSARVRGTNMDMGAKALICFADKKPILIVLPCSTKLDVKSFKNLFGVKDLRFSTPQEVENLTGLQIGAIPPLGLLFGMTTYIENNLGTNETIAFNAGDRCKSIIMRYSDYEQVCGGIIGQYGQTKETSPKAS
ncbi:MAG: YbaK/EbsC family protein [Candidatus Amesbacteria bacterium]|nr:YbaK/EbsC family protein [Candidatus Amesbacteria bacterium]